MSFSSISAFSFSNTCCIIGKSHRVRMTITKSTLQWNTVSYFSRSLDLIQVKCRNNTVINGFFFSWQKLIFSVDRALIKKHQPSKARESEGKDVIISIRCYLIYRWRNFRDTFYFVILRLENSLFFRKTLYFESL